jgi:hypothetical protein
MDRLSLLTPFKKGHRRERIIFNGIRMSPDHILMNGFSGRYKCHIRGCREKMGLR